MEMVDPFGWHTVDKETILSIRTKLSQFETMTWGSILNGKNHHNVEVDRLCSAARKRLDEMKQYDLEEILSLHLSGKERVWGILAEGVCTVLWWDPEHQICPALLKHT